MKYYHLFLNYSLMPLVFFMIFRGEGFSQGINADSLLMVISGQPDNQEKAVNLLKLGRHYYFIDYDSSFYYLDQAHDLSARIDYSEGEADALYLKSLIFFRKMDFKSSLTNIEKYTELVLYMEDSLRLAKGYSHLGNLHQDLSDYDLARFYCQKSLDIYLPLKDTTGIIANYNCIGNIFKGKSEYDSSAYYFLKVINLCEHTGDLRNMPYILSNLGNVYLADEQYDNASKYFNLSLEINKKNNTTRNLAKNYLNLGRVASEKYEFEEALDYYNKADELFKLYQDNQGITELQNNYGDLFFKQKKYEQALTAFGNALEDYRRTGYRRGKIVAMENMAAVYSELGNIEQAMSLQDSCLALAYQEGGRELRIDILGNISDNYQKTGDYRKAFDFLKQKYILKDSVFNFNKTKVINDLALKYDKEKDQAHILALEKDNLQKTNQRNAYMFSGLGIIVLALFIFIYLRQRATHDKFIAGQKIRQLEEEKKLMAAKLLVEGQEEERKRIATELHDGLGVLLSATKMQFSIISDSSPQNKELIDKATKMLEQASGDVRKISHNMMPGLLTKLGFYEAVEDLFENLGDTNGLNVVCQISGEQERLSENKEIMLYRIVQELVNNTLKHAEAGKIELRISVLPGMLDITYTDDGNGFDVSEKLESGSIGLKSIQSRINFLNGQMVIESKPGQGVKFTFQIPV